MRQSPYPAKVKSNIRNPLTWALISSKCNVFSINFISGSLNKLSSSSLTAIFWKKNICFKIVSHCKMLSERNSSHKILTAKKVKCHRTTTFNFCCCFSKTLSNTLSAPCKMPHKINVQLAPCHNPLMKKISIVLKYVLNLPFLLPPTGIYMYLVKNPVNEICHLFQKSLIEIAL